MKWLRLVIILVVVMALVYLISMFYVEENRDFKIVKEIDFSNEKVFEQFVDVQKFASWYDFTEDHQELTFQYFSPYHGSGSSLHFENHKKDINGELFVRKVVPNKKVSYDLLHGNDTHPYKISVTFTPKSKEKTKLLWHIQTPPRTFLKRSLNLLSEERFTTSLNRSMQHLQSLLSGKVDQDTKLRSIKYDTLTVETRNAELLLGVSGASSNKGKQELYKSILRSYTMLQVFFTQDLGKKHDEFGTPQLVLRGNVINDKEISYFFGAEVNEEFKVDDNSFTFRKIDGGDFLTIYYRGKYDERKSAILKLLKAAKDREVVTGALYEMFVQPPAEDGEVVLKIMLEIS